jgi:hypothetical protein
LAKYYTAIGPIDYPIEIQETLIKIGAFLASEKYTLRSGASEGFEYTIESGCNKAKGAKEIWLPWFKYEDHSSKLRWEQNGWDFISKRKKDWDTLKLTHKIYLARIPHQLLGLNLDEPSKFMLTWSYQGKGAHIFEEALKIAKEYKIPVFDLGDEKGLLKFKKYCKKKL